MIKLQINPILIRLLRPWDIWRAGNGCCRMGWVTIRNFEVSVWTEKQSVHKVCIIYTKYGDPGNEMRPSIEGLVTVCTVTLFQLILKNFKRRQDFDPGASFECFDAHSSMGKEKRSLTVLQNSGEMSFWTRMLWRQHNFNAWPPLEELKHLDIMDI